MLLTKLPRRFSKSPSAGGRPDVTGARTIAKRFRLEELIGRGGMGEVWSAYDTTLGRRVAVKVVELGGEELDDTAARFSLEAVLSKQLRGPAFVEVFAHGTDAQTAYLAMELLEGETLEDRLRRSGTLTVAEARDLLNGIGGALRLAHALQIVHRDLKPANIFFAKIKASTSGARPIDGRTEVLKLLDFGIAKDAWDDARLTRPGVLLGSAHYMSPEQVRSSDVDSRSDLWSLGVLLYRCLTGSRPFAGSAAEALGAIVDGRAPRATSVEPKLPRKLDGFFERAFQKNPARRFQNIDDMIDAFVAAALDAPLSSRMSIDIEFDDIVGVGASGGSATNDVRRFGDFAHPSWRDSSDEACDARPTLLDRPQPKPEAESSANRPTVPEGVRPARIAAAPRPVLAGSMMPDRAPHDSDAREAWLPLVMPQGAPSAGPDRSPDKRPAALPISAAARPAPRSRSTLVLFLVFLLLALAIGVAWVAGNTKTRLFVFGSTAASSM